MASRCVVVRTGVAGQGAAPVCSEVGEVACMRCAVAEFAISGQEAVPVGNGMGQVASRCAVVGTGEAGQGTCRQRSSFSHVR